jgi:hypothetical protein
VIDSIIAAARVRPVVIQSMFMCVDGRPPEWAEKCAYIDRLQEIQRAGGRIASVQVYTVARRTAEPYVTALPNEEIDHIVDLVQRHGHVRAEPFYGM